jgi:hypothetical protein
MDELSFVYMTAAVILGVGLWHVARKTFDPFSPLWLFLLGYLQVYVIQAISYHEWAIRVRGVDLVTRANVRALWALTWFLIVYHSPIGRWVASRLPRAPTRWSPGLITGMSPLLVTWGLVCAGLVLSEGGQREVTAEETLLRQFPIVMLVAGILLAVTGLQRGHPRPAMAVAGLGIAAGYVILWMFNGKRSHSLIGVLSMLAAVYIPRARRPPVPVLLATAFLGSLVVSASLGWRNNYRYERSFSGFAQYLGDFELSSILVNLNLKHRGEIENVAEETVSYETEEYGGYLLMMDTVPDKSGHDHGAPYVRLVSTYIPRILWPEKPYFGREEWVNAWIAGSEYPRDTHFTGPAIGVLGAAHLNGGAWATVLVLAGLALLIRTAYEYFRLYASTPWAQAWWALTFYNAWLMTVNDDPFVWFYYLYGHTILPPMVFLWIYHKVMGVSEPGSGEVSWS